MATSARARLGWRYNVAVMIAQELLDILVCPVCKTQVVLQPNGTGLKCVQCHRLYPIEDDIPVMLVDSAKIEP
ncbi:MAG TPA: Trm112 family protein [Terriglobales bacterium]|nr:Trm112 family protein [Terriglobales bacterium]